MSWNRRELLGGLGIASASSILWAMGCRTPHVATRTIRGGDDEIRAWLQTAVATLAGAFPQVHALAVSRRRTTAAIDALGAGVSRGRVDGVVASVRDRDGRREQASSDLSARGIATLVDRLLDGAKPKTGHTRFGAPLVMASPVKGDPRSLDDRALLGRVDGMEAVTANSRIIYAAGLLDIDDTTVWSVAPDHDREQRSVRTRRTATRVAWNGTRPVVGEVTIAWSGGIDDRKLGPEDVGAAVRGAVELMTPGAFDDGPHELLLDPSVTASVIDAAARALLTTTAARRPEVGRRLAIGASVASPVLTLVDDPTTPGAYGGFAFDDEGALAAPVTLLDRGHVAGLLADRASNVLPAGRGRRPGHLGPLGPAPSHLRLMPGGGDERALLEHGYVLEGGTSAVVDPASDRVVIAAARAREVEKGALTGRVYADVELVGALSALLASVTAASKATRTFGIREDQGGEPTWRSIEAPWLLGQGIVRARRRPA